ncbi:hypothetical protein [Bradyrhizobium sp. HKCCYLRH1062]|uniref:hypothetical protein n=1 Tax=unclassified Bradyrhizobium TaxID=2631580 RepID=UPI003EBF659D
MAPVEVKLVLSALARECHLISSDPKRELGGRIALDIIMPKVERDVLGWSKNIGREVNDGKPPRVLALFMMMNVVRDYLASGRFHVVRGRLSMQGSALKGLNAYCLTELAKLGAMTADDVRAASKATNEEIAVVG